MTDPKTKDIIIVHFQPLELYPPIMNIIDFLSKESGIQLKVISNKKSSKNKLNQYDPGPGVKIFRSGIQTNNNFFRYVNYFSFYLTALILLLWHRPKTVFYFETLSSWPALLYKKIMGSVRVMVHYHEYTEPDLYQQGMVLSRWMHCMESKMYARFSWISHTNPVRLQMFKDDEHLNNLTSDRFHIMPNYPSKKWLSLSEPDKLVSKLKRLVFVGSLGYNNMYLKEMVDWVGSKQGEFTIDFYSYNIKEKAKKLIEQCGLKNIKYCGGCDYQNLPQIMKKYDIGLVIYKPFSQNTIHAVSNKVFEYLACGLDVWFSDDMAYTFNFKRDHVYPKIIPVNFEKLNLFDFKSAISREGLSFDPGTFYYESIYPEMANHIKNDTKEIE